MISNKAPPEFVESQKPCKSIGYETHNYWVLKSIYFSYLKKLKKIDIKKFAFRNYLLLLLCQTMIFWICLNAVKSVLADISSVSISPSSEQTLL